MAATEEKTTDPCCPPDALGYLKIDGPRAGKIVSVEYYQTGSGTKCLIVYPDVWGWNSGRTRLLADQFARELKCIAVVPKVQDPLREGTDGDALPPDFAINDKTRAEFMKWVSGNTWAKIGPVVKLMMAQLKAQGVTEWATVGFCWGGWACANTIKDNPGAFKACAIAHPSIQLEGVFGADPKTLTNAIDCPTMLCPAESDDRKLYDPEKGALFQVLKAKSFGNKCSSTYYIGMAHGFMTRGDGNDKKVADGVKKCFEQMVAFYKANGFGGVENEAVATDSCALL